MNTYSFILLFVVVALFISLYYIRKKQKHNQLSFIFTIDIILIALQCICTFIQSLLIPLNNAELLFKVEYITYIANVFMPVSLLYTGLIFANTKIKFKKAHLLLFIIPVLSLIMLWTNNYHHLFYVTYSTNLNETVFGSYVNVHRIYTYLLLFVGVFYLLKYSIKNAGFFSKQSVFISLGVLVPIVVNILGSFGIIKMSIYLTPISFAITILFFAIAIFKFKFLSATPIAMQRIVDRMSDSFLVINEDGIITDFNDTFLRTFKLDANKVRNANFMKFIDSYNLGDLNKELIDSTFDKCVKTKETVLVKRELNIKNKYFNIEASGIFSKSSFLGILLLLKDVTQHVIDRNTIEDNQSMLMEKERLASLGQMIGGIAHNLKTPIMAISGATEGLSDLAKEYDSSIDDPEVTKEDHHAIATDMKNWIEKINIQTSYMSEVITAVKGQAVAFSDISGDSFTISELLTHVNVLMKHELKSALIELNTSVLVPESLSIKGNVNSLVQVINNMISNAIQSYNGKTNKNIDFIIKMKGNDLIFSIQDYGCGMPKNVQEKLFKEMITTKGKNGTGLGLFMSYSNIRAHFSGNISFESEVGKGTRFDITIPIN